MQPRAGGMTDLPRGIVRKVFELPFPRGLPPLFRLCAYLERPPRSSGVSSTFFDVTANGVGIARDAAWVRCRGEAIERYALHDFSSRSVRVAPIAESCDRDVFDPSSVETFGAHPTWDRTNPIGWSMASDAISGSSVYVPASLVSWVSGERSGGAFYPTSTSGVAAGADEQSASLAALMELIERDAIMAAWYLGTPVRAIGLDGPLGRSVRERFGAYLDNRVADVRFFSLHSETGLPVVLAAVRAKHFSTCYVGACASTDLEHAIEKAMTEAYTALSVCFRRESPRAHPPAGPEVPARLGDFADHASYYHSLTRATVMHAFLAEREVVELEAIAGEHDPAASVASRYEEVVRRLARFVEAAYLVRIDAPDRLELGMRVVRAIVPGLLPLALQNDWIPTRRKLRGAWVDTRLVRQAPHPFP